MTTGVSSPPKSRQDVKNADREYRRTQLHVLEQCTPGEAYEPEAGDNRMETVFQALPAEGLLVAIGQGRYVITASGQERRNRLWRRRWWQWVLDNLHWLVPTLVAVCSVAVAAMAYAASQNW